MEEELQRPRFERPHRRKAALAQATERYSVSDDLTITARGSGWPKEKTFPLGPSLRGLVQRPLALAIAHALGAYYVRFAPQTSGERHRLATNFFAASRERLLAGRSAPLRSFVLPEVAARFRSEFDRAILDIAKREDIILTSKAESKAGLFLPLSELASCGLVPTLERPGNPANYHHAGGKRAGLLEQSGASLTEFQQKEHANFLKDAQAIGLSLDSDEAKNFIFALVSEAGVTALSDELSFHRAIIETNRKILLRLRIAAEDQYLEFSRLYEQGEIHLRAADRSVLDVFDAGKLDASMPKEIWRSYFPPNNPARSTANLLLLCRERMQSRVNPDGAGPLKTRMMEIVPNLGGAYHLDGMINFHRAGVASGAIMYMCDSGNNPSPIVDMRRDYEEATDRKNFVKIHSVKARAGDHPIIDVLPIKVANQRISSVRALREISARTSTLHKAHPNLEDYLFVFVYFKRPSVMSAEYLADSLKALCKKAKLPSKWQLSGIRMAVAMDAASTARGRLKEVQNRMKQKSDGPVTAGYGLSFPIKLMLTRLIATYQNHMEAAFATHTSGQIVIVGGTGDATEARLEGAIRTGLGFMCRDEKSSSIEGAVQGEICTKVGECARCNQSYFVSDPQSIGEVIAVNRILNQKRLELEATQPGAWTETWAHLFAFTHVVLEKVKRSRFARLIPEAEWIAEALLEVEFDPTQLRP